MQFLARNAQFLSFAFAPAQLDKFVPLPIGGYL